MTDNARKARNQYARAWRARNKEKVKAANQRYWEKKATQIDDDETPEGRARKCGG